MQAAVVNVLGEAPRYQSFPDPVAGEGEVEVSVRAAGLHPIVKALASGSHYSAAGEVPAVPGIDGVGTLANGSRVCFGLSASLGERWLSVPWHPRRCACPCPMA